jgi:hypothetical protein
LHILPCCYSHHLRKKKARLLKRSGRNKNVSQTKRKRRKNVRVNFNPITHIEKLEEEAKLSTFEKKQKELQEMDRIFQEMGIEVDNTGSQEEQKKNKRRRKKNKNKDKDAENVENKTEENKEEKKDDKVVIAEPEPAVETTEKLPEDPEAREAAVKEALNKRFNKAKKKTQKDDALLLAKKAAAEKAKKKKKGSKKGGYDL